MEKVLKNLTVAQKEVVGRLLKSKGSLVVGSAYLVGTKRSTYYYKDVNNENQNITNLKINKKIINKLLEKKLLVSPSKPSNFLVLNPNVFKENPLKKLEDVYEKGFYHFSTSFVKKYKHLSKLEIINKFFKEYVPNFYLQSMREDYDEQEMEEYGVYDLDETLHLALNIRKDSYSSFVVKEYFDFENFSFVASDIRKINSVYPDFNLNHGRIISNFIRLVDSTKKD